MKRILIVLAALVMVSGFAAAETAFEDYESSIREFAEGVANSLPLNSSVGLTWSDAYIGQFPRFGVGATVGFSTIPYAALEPVVEALGLTEDVEGSELFEYLERFGGPLPAYTVEARLGGFMLPFDVGAKFGTIPPSVETGGIVEGFEFDYLLAGGDVRVNLLRGRGIAPKLSVGGAYNFLDARVGLVGQKDIEITSFEDPRVQTTYDLSLESPTVEYFWRANVLDFTVQASKDILLFTPYIGAGASIGFGSAGGGLRGTLVSDPEISDDDWEAINAALEAQGGETLPNLGPQGLSVTADMPAGWAFRAYGGVSLNLLILRLDLTGMYDFLGQNYGATVGMRIQF